MGCMKGGEALARGAAVEKARHKVGYSNLITSPPLPSPHPQPPPLENALAARRRLLPVAAFPLLTLGDLICIWHELKAVTLASLNRERGELVAQAWADEGRVRAPLQLLGRWLLPFACLPCRPVARACVLLDWGLFCGEWRRC